MNQAKPLPKLNAGQLGQWRRVNTIANWKFNKKPSKPITLRRQDVKP